MKITVKVTESVEKNAAVYYEKAKKAKAKIVGATEAVERAKKKIEQLRKQKKVEKKEEVVEKGKPQWYHKFRWFISSQGFLCVGGRDATTNEIIIKKHADKDDIVFHTDMAGSPFFVIKTEGKKPGKATMQECADATVSFSRAWKGSFMTSPVFWVKPEQVTKEAKAGEYLGRGAFMIKGKTNYIENKMNVAVGITKDNFIMAGPVEAVEKHCQKHVEIVQGNEKVSAIAKLIRRQIGGELDEIIRTMPPGGCKIKK